MYHEFKINYEKKKITHRKLMNHIKGAIIIRIIGWGLLFLTIFLSIKKMYSNSFATSIIIMQLIITTVAALITFICIKIADIIAGGYAKNRLKEEIILYENKMEYKYKLKSMDDGTEKGKCIVSFPLKYINVTYNNKINELIFHGNIYCEYEDGAPEITDMIPCGNIQKFTICDYFEPPLIEVLKNRSVNLNIYERNK